MDQSLLQQECAFIFWLAIQDGLFTFDRLVKCGWQGNLLCGFCRNKCESRDHISLNVPFQAGYGSK